MQEISFEQLAALVMEMRERVMEHVGGEYDEPIKAYAVPSGGVPAALALSGAMDIHLVDSPAEADIIIDDLIDSGATASRPEFAGKPFFALIDKREWNHRDEWVQWPWDKTLEQGIESHITRLIQFAGDDPTRGGLLETPKRVAKAWKFWCSGYEVDPAEVLKVFEDGAEGCDEMVVVKDIPFYTHCEHHMAPFFGTATIAYLPDGKIVGLSKLSRLLDVFARRLQVQERLTGQVADALMQHLKPKGAAVVIKARHMCMESRGVCQQGHHTITSALRGAFKEEPETRSEFTRLAM
jgi:GTP cyclohydrolase I